MTDTRRVAVVVNPSKVAADDKAREQVEKAVRDVGWDAPTWLETTKDDPGKGMAEQAVRDGHDVVLAMGGDGTVMSCITALAGSGVPIGVLPAGTGNLLARNLDRARRSRGTDTPTIARTTTGSNWPPAWRTSSSSAAARLTGRRYARAAVITSYASATATIREQRPIASAAKPFG